MTGKDKMGDGTTGRANAWTEGYPWTPLDHSELDLDTSTPTRVALSDVQFNFERPILAEFRSDIIFA